MLWTWTRWSTQNLYWCCVPYILELLDPLSCLEQNFLIIFSSLNSNVETVVQTLCVDCYIVIGIWIKPFLEITFVITMSQLLGLLSFLILKKVCLLFWRDPVIFLERYVFWSKNDHGVIKTYNCIKTKFCFLRVPWWMNTNIITLMFSKISFSRTGLKYVLNCWGCWKNLFKVR